MHSYKITVHFLDATCVAVYLRDTTADKSAIIDSFARTEWIRSDDDDMVINTRNITYIVIDEIGKENDNG